MNSDQFRQAFIEESMELLSSLESKLLEMEESPSDIEKVSAVFRVIHTIKGSAAMFGFNEISEFTHHVENILDMVRNGELEVSRNLVDWTLKSGDHISALIESDEDEQQKQLLVEASDEIVSGFKTALGISVPDFTAPAVSQSEQKDEAAESILWRIRFKPSADIFKSGTNPLLLIEELCEFGEHLVVPIIDTIPEIKDIDPETCYTGWDILLLTDRSENDLRDVFIFVEFDSEIQIEQLPKEEFSLDDGKPPRLGEILLNRGDINEDALKALLEKQKKLGQLILENNIATKDAVDSALNEQNFIKTVSEKRNEKSGATSLRVSSDKLDELVNLVGELVTVHARIARESKYQYRNAYDGRTARPDYRKSPGKYYEHAASAHRNDLCAL